MGARRRGGWRGGGQLAALLSFCVVALVLRAAVAAVTLPTPAGWDADAEVSPQARHAVDAWAARLSGTVVSVRATHADDDFAELAAAIRQARPIRPGALRDPDRALELLREAATPLFDAGADPVFTRALEIAGVAAARARWEVEGVTWDLVLVPDGSARVVVIMRARSDELVFYDRTFEALVAGIDGAVAPVVPFDRQRWRGGVILGLALIGACSFLIGLLRSHRDRDFELAGRVAALAVGAATLLGLALGGLLLSGRGPSLEVVGYSLGRALGELLLVGVAIAGVAAIVGRWLDPGERRVASAPRTGTFRRDALHLEKGASPELGGAPGPHAPPGPGGHEEDLGVPRPVIDPPPR